MDLVGKACLCEDSEINLLGLKGAAHRYEAAITAVLDVVGSQVDAGGLGFGVSLPLLLLLQRETL